MSLARYLLYLTISALLSPASSLAQSVDAQTQWQAFGGSHALEGEVARHETSSVAIGDKIYLIGGRRNRPTLVLDTTTGIWSNLGLAPLELHHFQPVAIGTDIYVLGSMFGGGFPEEQSDPNIRVFDTLENQWSVVGQIPSDRLRGSAGVVLRGNKIFLVGGNTRGHNGGAVAWLDSYDPLTQEWQILLDAPNARDHFAAVVINDKLIVAGGRQSDSDAGRLFSGTVQGTDVYDFSTGSWASGADIPTQRAGAVVATAGDELLVAGGESGDSNLALSTVEAYDVVNDSWRTLQSMITARHSGGSAVVGMDWHVFSGSVTRGGGPDNETSLHETLELNVEADTDNDGLSDIAEMSIYSTDPNDPDTDNDLLFDGPEVNTFESDPLVADTDLDVLPDGDEVTIWQSSPTLVDTDDDQLDDGEEVFDWQSNPANQDTDNDQLSDGDEVNKFSTSPTLADTDADNLDDYAEISAGTDPLDPDTDQDGLLDGDDPSPLVAEESSLVVAENTGGSGGGGFLGMASWLLIGLMLLLMVRLRGNSSVH